MSKLVDSRCANCAPGTPPLTPERQAELGREIPAWENKAGQRIQREYKFKTYLDGIAWVQLAGRVVDAEDHHPDLHVLYRKVLVELWTHTVNGLSENDYIVAAKLDQCYESFEGKR